MIISRAPVRISLGGGGTDLKSYYEKYDGFVISATINKYIYVISNKRFDNSVRLSYSETEIVNNINDIKHNLFREALKSTMVNSGIELSSMADVPANCGLGTSSAFLIALLTNLYAYCNFDYRSCFIPEVACDIEIKILGEPIGKQDQYTAFNGGLKSYEFKKDGTVNVESIDISPKRLKKLQDNLLLVYLDKNRFASDILKNQNEKCLEDDKYIVSRLHEIKDIGYVTKSTLETGNIDDIGKLFDVHWKIKKELSKEISNEFIDEVYDIGLENGALGGKVVGAGGGGFMLFYCENKALVIKAMKHLKSMTFKFESEGVKLL